MTRDIHRAIMRAMQRCPEPVVRIWLTRDDLGLIHAGQASGTYCGVPVSEAHHGTVSRVIDNTGRAVPI